MNLSIENVGGPPRPLSEHTQGILAPPTRGGGIWRHSSALPRKDIKDVHTPIWSVYPPQEDLRFVLNNAEKMSGPQLAYYVQENIIGFLGEFAGKIPFKPMNGLLLDNGELQIGGFDMLESSQNAVTFKERRGMNASREQAELEGLMKIRQLLAYPSPSECGATWVSGSLDRADYMMVFGIVVGAHDTQLGGAPIQEYILRKPEQRGDITSSMEYFHEAAHLAGHKTPVIRTAEDMLRSPIPMRDGLQLANMLNLAGISQEDIQYSQTYESFARRMFAPLIKEYSDIVQFYQGTDIDSPAHASLVTEFNTQAKPLIENMFKLGTHLRRFLKGEMKQDEESRFSRLLGSHPSNSGESRDRLISGDVLMAYAHAHAHAPEHIVGGSLCPSWISDINMASNVNTLMNLGLSLTQAFGVLIEKKGTTRLLLPAPVNRTVEVPYTFDDYGPCRQCTNHREVGPCDICMSCTINIMVADATTHTRLAPTSPSKVPM